MQIDQQPWQTMQFPHKCSVGGWHCGVICFSYSRAPAPTFRIILIFSSSTGWSNMSSSRDANVERVEIIVLPAWARSLSWRMASTIADARFLAWISIGSPSGEGLCYASANADIIG